VDQKCVSNIEGREGFSGEGKAQKSEGEVGVGVENRIALEQLEVKASEEEEEEEEETTVYNSREKWIASKMGEGLG